MVGPTDDGCFLELRVCSIQRNRSACRVLRAGQAATLALGDFDRALLRKVRWTNGLEREHKKCMEDWLLKEKHLSHTVQKPKGAWECRPGYVDY